MVWTDAFQDAVMYAGILAIIIQVKLFGMFLSLLFKNTLGYY